MPRRVRSSPGRCRREHDCGHDHRSRRAHRLERGVTAERPLHEPLVTVCVPLYNKAGFVEATLESVLAQTLEDWELIVIDDASTDGSVAVVEAWLARHEDLTRCRLLRHETNQGVCRTLNEGLALARGRYWVTLGADDLLLPQMLEGCVARLAEAPDEVAVAYGDAEVMDETGRPLPGRFVETYRPGQRPPQGYIFAELWQGNFIPAMAALARTKAVRACGGYDQTLAVEDWDMWLRLAERHRFAVVPEALARYRIVPGSLSRSAEKAEALRQSERRMRLRWIERHDPRRGPLEQALYWPNGAGMLYEAGHPGAAAFAARQWREERSGRAALLLLCARLRVPARALSWLYRRFAGSS